MESETDLLICGAGPTGLVLALWATQYDIKARIIDSKAHRIQTGHADGLHSRTLEILDSFGLMRYVLGYVYPEVYYVALYG